ncbi:NAD(P)-binding protein [Cristinia sonorae]|uniref:Probable quinone oxidoreductase n=1 Tax=Cristinia sonorae TaxID=1940300 RepID=A0A8K0UMI7_9AGAR|nr:NAD(P)-binding protein [Cristinia sonorae]
MSFPETVQALAFNKIGGVEELQKISVPFPEHKPGTIVVKVHWFGVNTIDTYFRKGLYPIEKFPQTSGLEASGVIAALPTDEATLNNPDYQKRRFKIGDNVAVYGIGAHAEYTVVPWLKTFPVPEGIPLDVACASSLQGLTAVTHMTEAHNVQKGETILIHTVAGHLGLLYTQYAKSRGATVIGTTSSEEKAELAKSFGADHVILYTKENTVDRVLEITKGEGVHAVFDGVGKATFMNNFKLVRRKGTLIAVGNASGPVDPINPLLLGAKNLKLVRPSMAVYITTPEETEHYLSELFRVLADGSVKVRIANVYPFTTEGGRQAQIDLTTPGGKIAGKLLIKVSDE